MASNLTQATRAFIDKTWKSAVGFSSPLFTRLIERKQVLKGGTQFEQVYESSDDQSLVQRYGPNDRLEGGSKEFITRPHWHVALMQTPLEQDVDEAIMNAPPGDTQLVNLAEKKAARAITALKNECMDLMYSCMVDNEIDSRHTYMQGLPSALIYDLQYGGLTRTGTTTNPTWQAADAAASEAAATLNPYNLDTWIDSCVEYAQDRADFLIVMGQTLFNQFKRVLDANNEYRVEGTVAKQGFESIIWNGVEIAKDFHLDRMTYLGATNNQGSHTINHKSATDVGAGGGSIVSAGLTGYSVHSGGEKFVFVLDLNTWHLRYTFQSPKGGSNAKERAGNSIFTLSDYFAQDQIEGGVEKSLARAKFKGNLTCDLPNRNLMRTYVS
jgi:hypothetical protein